MRKKARDVLADPAVAAIYHKSHRDVAERLYNKASNEGTAWRKIAEELAIENAQLRMRQVLAADTLKRHDDATENPFADPPEPGAQP